MGDYYKKEKEHMLIVKTIVYTILFFTFLLLNKILAFIITIFLLSDLVYDVNDYRTYMKWKRTNKNES